ncbi:hypothetical protein D3W54_07870 [Komagataeibacter medellinensis]|uniref:Type II toxin-antitoxin system RelE/ParE family toxin n=1 Tax=Komagataeibacter medellinensis TaxID=1177712 RepID=A0ABQ6VVA7_9PROT|nr:hypothetical protein D3W54_07870 [Komagataeibacter medellinensis]
MARKTGCRRAKIRFFPYFFNSLLDWDFFLIKLAITVFHSSARQEIKDSLNALVFPPDHDPAGRVSRQIISYKIRVDFELVIMFMDKS